MKKMIVVLFTCSFLLLSVQGMANAEDSSKRDFLYRKQCK